MRVIKRGEYVVRKRGVLNPRHNVVEGFFKRKNGGDDKRRAVIEFSVYEGSAFFHAIDKVALRQIFQRPRHRDAAHPVNFRQFDFGRQFFAYFQLAAFDFRDNIVIHRAV